jgi:hypothetical protein
MEDQVFSILDPILRNAYGKLTYDHYRDFSKVAEATVRGLISPAGPVTRIEDIVAQVYTILIVQMHKKIDDLVMRLDDASQ